MGCLRTSSVNPMSFLGCIGSGRDYASFCVPSFWSGDRKAGTISFSADHPLKIKQIDQLVDMRFIPIPADSTFLQIVAFLLHRVVEFVLDYIVGLSLKVNESLKPSGFHVGLANPSSFKECVNPT